MAQPPITLCSTLFSYLQSQYSQLNEQTLSTPTSLPISTVISALETAKATISSGLSLSNVFPTLSTSTLPGQASWIARVRRLHLNITHAQDAAQAMVEKHAAAQVLQEAVQDKSAQIGLLQREVSFSEALAGQLEALAVAAGLIDSTHGLLLFNEGSSGIKDAVAKLAQARKVCYGVQAEAQGARVVHVLDRRLEGVRKEITDALHEKWTDLVKVDTVYRQEIVVKAQHDAGETLEELVEAMKDLGIFTAAVSQFHRQLDNLIISPRLLPLGDGTVAQLEVDETSIRIKGRQKTNDATELIRDVFALVGFLNRVFPQCMASNVLGRLLPSIVLQLVSGFLDPSMPLALDLDHLDSFKSVISEVENLSRFLTSTTSVDLPSEANLDLWIEQLPQTWIDKRQQKALKDMRSQCYDAVKIKQTAEKFEPSSLAPPNHAVFETEGQAQLQAEIEAGDEEEDSWARKWIEGNDDEAESKTDAPMPHIEDDDNWEKNWIDSEPTNFIKPLNFTKPTKPRTAKLTKLESNTKPKPEKSKLTELTARETFMVTSIPSSIIELLSSLLNDAAALVSPSFPLPSLTPAATALATIPALLLAFYRATSSTYYVNEPLSNMLIYNDTQHLIHLLSDSFMPYVSANHPLVSHLQLDSDIQSLSAFAQRIYFFEMDLQRTVVGDMLSSASAFLNVTKPLNRTRYTEILDNSVQRVRDMDSVWRGVLTTSLRLQSLGSLIQSLTAHIVNDVLERAVEDVQDQADGLGGISEEASKLLKGFVDKIAELQDLFEEGGRTVVYRYCPNWLRFMYLGEILEASLVDIRYLWTEGELALEFDSSEVIDLIVALFERSSHRKEAIREIKNNPGAKINAG